MLGVLFWGRSGGGLSCQMAPGGKEATATLGWEEVTGAAKFEGATGTWWGVETARPFA